MGSKHSLLNRFDQWLHEAPPSQNPNRPVSQQPRREANVVGRTGQHSKPPFYIRWWMGAHHD